MEKKPLHLSIPHDDCLVTQHNYVKFKKQQLEAEMKATLEEGKPVRKDQSLLKKIQQT